MSELIKNYDIIKLKDLDVLVIPKSAYSIVEKEIKKALHFCENKENASITIAENLKSEDIIIVGGRYGISETYKVIGIQKDKNILKIRIRNSDEYVSTHVSYPEEPIGINFISNKKWNNLCAISNGLGSLD